MRVIFRADAATTIGSGHVMRCLTLANELRDEGAAVEFVHKRQEGDLTTYIQEAGYRVLSLPAECGPAADAELTRQALVGAVRPAWLVVDHYGLGRPWEATLRPHVEHLMVIDDLADAPHDCHVLLNQNLMEDPSIYEELLPEGSRALVGPRYALLRSEFARQRAVLGEPRPGVERILVSFGGTDPTGETVKFLRQLRGSKYRGLLEPDCVVGQGSRHLSELQQLAREIPGVKLHVQTRDIARLMAEADVCIGAGGATTWERFCLGLPTLAVAVAPNQVASCELLSRRGYCHYLGDATVTEIDYVGAIDLAMEQEAELQAMAAKGMTLVDGLGAPRVAKQLLEAT